MPATGTKCRYIIVPWLTLFFYAMPIFVHKRPICGRSSLWHWGHNIPTEQDQRSGSWCPDSVFHEATKSHGTDNVILHYLCHCCVKNANVFLMFPQHNRSSINSTFHYADDGRMTIPLSIYQPRLIHWHLGVVSLQRFDVVLGLLPRI